MSPEFSSRPVASLEAALAGRYVVERELGRGGMATVYLARDLRHARPVAVKVFLPEVGALLGPERFLREIATVAQLNHPHILPLFDSGAADDGVLYYVMPYVAGESLRERLRREGPLPTAEVSRVVREVAQALDYAHRRGVAHRDVKPENVLLDEEGHALVADFGIARGIQRAMPGAPLAADSTEAGPGPEPRTLTQTGAVIGTPTYMSPEQALGERELSGASDQYALACVAFELLTGAPPFVGSTAEQLVRRLTQPPPALTTQRPDLPAAADAVLARALAVAPQARFETATAFADALASAVAGAVAAPRAPTPITPSTGAAEPEGVGGVAPATRPRTGRRVVPARTALGAAVLTAAVVAAGGAVFLRARGTYSTGPLEAGGGASSGRPLAGAELPSLAVLPLKNYSGDSGQDYFAAGMTDELTATLTKIEGLRVIAHQSVLQFERSKQSVPEIARALGVRHVVDGSVLQDAGRVRITATLVDAATNAPVWTERFEREREDVLALQREVALAVARGVAAALTPRDLARLEDTAAVDPEAFDFYVRGTQARYLMSAFNARARQEAGDYFARAIARDSGYAPAYAGLAIVHMADGDEARARRSARRALALDSTLAEAHVVLGSIQQRYDRDWEGAEQSLRRAVRLNPGYAEARHELSMLLTRRRRFDEALREGQHTMYLAPTSWRFQLGVAEVYVFSGRYDEAVRAGEKALALDSSGLAAVNLLRGIAYGQLGRYEEAEKAVQASIRQSDVGDYGRSELGYLYAASGRRAEARSILEGFVARWRKGERGFVAYSAAKIHAGLGEREKALDWLERSVEAREWLDYMAIEPSFRSLHAEPRFQALLKEVGLDD